MAAMPMLVGKMGMEGDMLMYLLLFVSVVVVVVVALRLLSSTRKDDDDDAAAAAAAVSAMRSALTIRRIPNRFKKGMPDVVAVVEADAPIAFL
jgi:uncharacterized membrane protein